MVRPVRDRGQGPPRATSAWPLSLPAGFAPADPAYLGFAALDYGLPPQPADPAARALWLEMLQGLTFIAKAPGPKSRRTGTGPLSVLGVGLRAAGGADSGEHGEMPGTHAGGGSRIGTSRNWSGAVIFPHGGRRFVQIIARWTVPKIENGEGPGPFACSHWIGLDGFRRWMQSMPQMGTVQHLGPVIRNGPPVAHFAWRQWWLKGKGTIQNPLPIGPALNVGDAVWCCVTLLPPGTPTPGKEDQAHFFLRVNGSGKAYAAVDDPPAKKNEREVPATGASAQWIVERPKALKDSPGPDSPGAVKEGQIYPLPDFGECSTDRFAAVLAEGPEVIDLADPELATDRATLDTPRRLRMIEVAGTPERLSVIATPVEAKGQRVKVRYGR